MLSEYFERLLDLADPSTHAASSEAAGQAVESIKQQLESEVLRVSSAHSLRRESSVVTSVSHSRQAFFADHDRKARANLEFTRKLQKERKEREERERQRHEHLMSKLLEQRETEDMLRQDMMQHIEANKQQRLQTLQEQAAARKAYLNEKKKQGDEAYKEAIHTVPLYKKIEDRYQHFVQLPELERKKVELAKKRNLMSPVSIEALQEHARRHDLLRAQVRNKPSYKEQEVEAQLYLNSLPKTHFRKRVLDQEKHRKKVEADKELQKKVLAEKKRHYSRIVKEMFKPTHVLSPVSEIQEPVEKKSYTEPNRVALKKRKWKKNTMIPEPPVRPQPKEVNYLAEQRALRAGKQKGVPNIDVHRDVEALNDHSEKIARVKTITKTLEGQIKERKLGGAASDGDEQLTDMVIETIRAKLKILESLKT